ncbi:MAG TPA: hypothetical protein VN840_18420 [Streptosporangiaceae bacterium]|nr:hypothetical protein [Streptosporangiaceae bacterium]
MQRVKLIISRSPCAIVGVPGPAVPPACPGRLATPGWPAVPDEHAVPNKPAQTTAAQAAAMRASPGAGLGVRPCPAASRE